MSPIRAAATVWTSAGAACSSCATRPTSCWTCYCCRSPSCWCSCSCSARQSPATGMPTCSSCCPGSRSRRCCSPPYRGAQRRRPHRHLRPLPQPAHRPLGPADRTRLRRPRQVPGLPGAGVRLRRHPRLPPPRQPAGRARRVRADHAVHLRGQLISALVAMLAKSPASVQGLAFLLIFPLTFGSNVFVPTAQLPGWLQAWVKVNP